MKQLFCTTATVLFLPPPHSQRLRSLQIPHSPLHSFLSVPPPLPSTPLPHLPPSVPSPDTHPLQTEVRVQVLAAPSETKVCFRDAASCNSYFRDNSRWCHCSPGVSIQSDTLKSPLQNQAGTIFKKKQLGKKKFSFFHILSVSYHFPLIVNGEETQETEERDTGADTVAQHEFNLKPKCCAVPSPGKEPLSHCIC